MVQPKLLVMMLLNAVLPPRNHTPYRSLEYLHNSMGPQCFLEGQRAGTIGDGCSAVQFFPSMAKAAALVVRLGVRFDGPPYHNVGAALRDGDAGMRACQSAQSACMNAVTLSPLKLYL